MNREWDFDELLQTWMDDGADVAPERFVLLAIGQAKRTPQRGAWRATLEGLIMRLQPAAPILGVAAIAIAAIALYAVLSSSNVGNPVPTPRPVTTDELPGLVITAANAPEGLRVDQTLTGVQALVVGLPPGGPVMDRTGFLDAAETELSSVAGDQGLATWAAVFETAKDAEAAYGYVVARHEAADGWGLAPIEGASALGDERVVFRGPAYGRDEATIYLWRVNNVVMAAIGVYGTDEALVRDVAAGMDARAH